MSQPPDSDRELVLALQRDPRDRQAWRNLYLNLAPKLLRSLRARNRVTEDLAEDVIQETFLRLIARADRLSYCSPELFRALLWKTASTVLIDMIRKNQRSSQGLLDPQVAAQLATELKEEARQELAGRIVQFLETIEEPDRSLFRLRFEEHKSLEAVTKETGLSYSAIASRLSRLRTRLWEFLNKPT
jgi:RNA polymerase sigma factor (sigma-70 family)